MIGFVIAAAVFVGAWLSSRRRTGDVVPIRHAGPFPPYDWFAKEQGPEEVYPPRSGPTIPHS
jgi:hypothetical protein